MIFLFVFYYQLVLLERMSLWSLKGNVKCSFLGENCFSCSLGVLWISHLRGKKNLSKLIYLFKKRCTIISSYKPLQISQAGHSQYIECQHKYKIASYFPSKVSLFRISRELQSGTSEVLQTRGKFKETKRKVTFH